LKFSYTRDHKQVYVFSSIIALMMTAFSLAGILFSHSVYPTEALRQTFLANDVVDLVIGMPILALSMWLAWRGRLIGLLLWPGALFYIVYDYIAYAFAMWATGWFLPYLILLALSLYTMVALISRMDSTAIRQRLSGHMWERFVAGVLIGFGVLFFLRGVGVVAGDLSNGTPLDQVSLATTLADFLNTPVWVVGGIQLWRRRPFGYATGLGLLFQASMLFVGLIIFMILQPVLTTATFVLTDVIVIFVMGLVCFVPFFLAARNVARQG